MIKHVVLAVGMWIGLLIPRIIVILLGIVAVPIGVLFTKEAPSNRPHPKYPEWRLMKMPKIFWIWDNDRDGSMGDVRGNYERIQRPGFMKDNTYWKAVYWLAVRNPANNWSRFLRPNSVDVRTLRIAQLAGSFDVVKSNVKSYQFVIGRGYKFNYYGFYMLIPYKDGHWNIRLGHKIAPKHAGDGFEKDEQKALKGYTFRVLLDRV